jgi:hypothetical protein
MRNFDEILLDHLLLRSEVKNNLRIECRFQSPSGQKLSFFRMLH